MCGIAGFLDTRTRRPNGELLQIAGRMADTMLHRGPDSDGAWADAEAGMALGFRRLAIIDLTTAGHQPMVSADERHVIVFNGEIYNAEDIRAELMRAGAAPTGGWRGHSDTEVLLQACAHFGVAEAVKRLIGMFAFAVWNRATRRLTLVRDRLGIKPLYWGQFNGHILFGSELKALRVHPEFHAEMDPAALAGYLRFAYVPSPRSIYRDTHKLPPGHMLTVGMDGKPVIECYWNLRRIASDGVRNAATSTVSVETAREELETLMRDAVRRRMIADVPLGAFLSGGIDSSTVVAMMQAESDRPVKTFTIGFHEKRYNEAIHASQVAKHLGTDHTELYLQPDSALDLIPSIPEWFDEPFADSSQLPTYMVSHITRKYVTVALSGDGGDELFAGYDRYVWGTRFAEWRKMLPGPVGRLAAVTMQAMPARYWNALSHLLPADIRPPLVGQKIHKIAGLLTEPSTNGIHRRLSGFWHDPAEILNDMPEPEGELWDETLVADIPDFMSRMQYLDCATYLTDDILAKVDRASMAVSLEARVPLLDHRLVQHIWNLPLHMKLQSGTSKWLMRQVLYRYVPRELLDRPKMGFSVPIDTWLRGPMRDWAEGLLNAKRLTREGIFNPGPIRRKWAQHLAGERDWQYDLWIVLMFQAWRERWMP